MNNKKIVPDAVCVASSALYKGIFWIVDRKQLENNAPYFLKIATDRHGFVLSSDHELTSKKGDNYNHRLSWASLPHQLTDGKAYNYYPRGRVEIRNDEARIFINPLLNEDGIINYIREQFNLNGETIGKVRVLIDRSSHYRSGQN